MVTTGLRLARGEWIGQSVSGQTRAKDVPGHERNVVSLCKARARYTRNAIESLRAECQELKKGKNQNASAPTH